MSDRRRTRPAALLASFAISCSSSSAGTTDAGAQDATMILDGGGDAAEPSETGPGTDAGADTASDAASADASDATAEGSLVAMVLRSTPIYRLYNNANADHLFSTVATEGTGAGGYQQENSGNPVFYLAQADDAGVSGGALVPLYRCVIPPHGNHLLTTASDCENVSGANLDFDGSPLGYVLQPSTGVAVVPCVATALYRLDQVNTGAFTNDHIYTVNPAEAMQLEAMGFTSETWNAWAWNGATIMCQ